MWIQNSSGSIISMSFFFIKSCIRSTNVCIYCSVPVPIRMDSAPVFCFEPSGELTLCPAPGALAAQRPKTLTLQMAPPMSWRAKRMRALKMQGQNKNMTPTISSLHFTDSPLILHSSPATAEVPLAHTELSVDPGPSTMTPGTADDDVSPKPQKQNLDSLIFYLFT